MTLSVIARLRGKRLSDIARMARVSRAAVSLWMKKPVADIRARHLQSLAESLGVGMDTLMHPLPLLADAARVKILETSLLWDRLFPSIEDFGIALVRRDARAMARLVQVYGLFGAEKIIGRDAWRKFPGYSRHIHPERRKQCEGLCRELASHHLI